MRNLDFSKLLGFDVVAEMDTVDFQDATVGAKLGAKVGVEPVQPQKLVVDFQDPRFAAKLGAKVGLEPTAAE